ncbi:hypothetical protein [Nocardia cyriacigeorgica]|uniref:hypothetical protein n=1 Tax=Nocardia cyriacigeorgica TaxID=135487 RepID=UPI001894A37F|nr:hypothetical protein [Nocardia cyriacigeorgica]MBF6286157.1 hypothetical protein [Nocardia cyriacigeorgica]BDT85070.1 hypothetical protein FMUAM8_08340 [Nocardia cyriacigeorgica]
MAGENNPWGDLRTQAGNGGLVFTKDVATDAASYCADLVDVINMVVGSLDDVLKIEGLGHFPGAVRLANKFAEIAAEFRDEVMKEHKRIATDLGESFVLAGKLYEGTDLDGKGHFDSMVRTSNAGDLIKHVEQEQMYDGRWVDISPDIPNLGDYENKDSRYGGLPDSLLDLAGSEGSQGFSVTVPPAQTLNFNQLWWLGDQIRGKPAFIAVAGGDWFRMKLQLQSGFSNFDQSIQGLMDSDRWKGTGADGAARAVRLYTNNSGKLLTAMQQLSDNLVNASGWTANTVYGMPDQSVAYTPDDQEHAQLELARQVYANWYEPGITACATAIPIMPKPTDAVQIPNDDRQNTNNNGGNNGGGNNGGGNNGGGGTGSGTSAAQQQQQASLAQFAKDQQALTQQQRDMEAAQAKADAEARRQAAELRQQQELAQQQAEQRAQQQAAQQAAQQAQQALQQGLQQAQQAAQQGLQQAQQAAQQAMQQAGLAGLPQALSGLGKDLPNLKGGLGAGKGVGGGGAGGGAGAGGLGGLPKEPAQTQASKLFPRASAAGIAAGAMRGAGLAPIAGAPGAPGGMGPAGAGAGGGQQAKEHKRAEYLDSAEHIEEALGDAPVVAKPVVEK